MLSTICSAAVLGIQAYIVEVEVDLSYGLPGVSMVGLPDTAVQESRERVRSAIRNSGFNFPALKTTINMAPAHTRKTGPVFDLAIALGILQATEQIKCLALHEWVIIGELSLNGALRPIQGVLALSIAAAQAAKTKMLLPRANGAEAALIQNLDIYVAENLMEAVQILKNPENFTPLPSTNGKAVTAETKAMPDFAEVRGQLFAKRSLEIAAAGGHNLLMSGPPGSGKTMLARRIISILPEMDFTEALESTKIHSICGQLSNQYPQLLQTRPFRSPHHSISKAGLIGGQALPRPGEISLAHHGVLFLDELPEFRREILELLRQPLEEGSVTLSRAQYHLTYPARFILIAAMNPCPCGYWGDMEQPCQCTPGQRERYWSKLSGPLLDRIDLHVAVPRLKASDYQAKQPAESSREIRVRVYQARERQYQRFRHGSIRCNAQMQAADIQEFCILDTASRQLLHTAVDKLNLSGRAYDRILKVARTLADLDGERQILPEHLAEAIQFRAQDREQRCLSGLV